MGGSSVSIDLSHMHEDLSLTLEPMSKSLNAVVHACNPGSGKTETGRSLGFTGQLALPKQ